MTREEIIKIDTYIDGLKPVTFPYKVDGEDVPCIAWAWIENLRNNLKREFILSELKSDTSTANASHTESLDEIKDFVLPKIQKFIDKVESGRARSVETYADMKEIKDFLSHIQPNKRINITKEQIEKLVLSNGIGWVKLGISKEELIELWIPTHIEGVNDREIRCVWCGKTYAEHLDEPRDDGAVPRMPCTGLKRYFAPKDEPNKEDTASMKGSGE